MDDDLADTVITGDGRRARRGLREHGSVIEDGSEVEEATVIGAPPAAQPFVAASDAPSRAVAEPTGNGPSRAADSAPVRYRVRVSGGDAMPIDRVLLIGRAPKASRVTEGSAPGLIAVPSASREVSGTHLELRQQGAAIVATDLRSTNGTEVTLAGADRIVLRPGESLVVGPGAIIDIGDGNLIEVLPADRLVPVAGTDRMLP